MTKTEFLRRLPPFDRLQPSEWSIVTEHISSVEFAKGQRILDRDGIPSSYLYIIDTGTVALSREGQTYQMLERGEIFGYTVLIRNETPAFDIEADTDVELYCIPDVVCQKLIDNPDFSAFFFDGLSQRLRLASERNAPPPERNLATPLKNIMSHKLLFVQPTQTIQQAARIMHEGHASSVLVDSVPVGIVTDRDLRGRVLAQGLGPETLVHSVMTQPVKTLDSDGPVYAALIHMLAENIHHLPLVEEGKIVGIVTSSDLLRHQARSPLHLLRWVKRMDDADAAADYARQSGEMVEALFRGGLEAAQIGQIVSSLNDELITRLLRLAELELGSPPVPYAWIVFGSEGRLEQMLLTDQDNALVYAEETAESTHYFAELSQMVINGLIQAGFPPCPGGYMATNWCKPLADWIELFQSWLRRPEPQALMEAAIFFDFRSVHGELSLEPLESVVTSAKDEGLFLGHMVGVAQQFATPLTFFRRIREDQQGQVDIKAGGIAPIVGLARACSLAAGSRERSTLERLAVAAESGKMSSSGAENLAEIFRFLLKLRLGQQLAAINQGQQPTNNITVSELSLIERRHLKEAFVLVREMQEGIRL